MKLSFKEALNHDPCKGGFRDALKNCKKEAPDNELIDLKTLLPIIGIEYSFWVLRNFNYIDYCLFLLDVVENSQLLNKYNKDSQIPSIIAGGIKDYKNGIITLDDLKLLSKSSKGYANNVYFYLSNPDQAIKILPSCLAKLARETVAKINDCSFDNKIYERAVKDEWKEIEKQFIKHFIER